MDENEIKRQIWDSNQIYVITDSLQAVSHVGPLKQDSLIR